jgi:agmatinase
MEGPAAQSSLGLGTDPFQKLRIVDFGDVGTFPAGVVNVHRELRQTLDVILFFGALPVVLGVDHSAARPMLEALGEHFGPDGYAVIHLDAHNDVGLATDEIDHGNRFSLGVARGVLRADHKLCMGVLGLLALHASRARALGRARHAHDVGV